MISASQRCHVKVLCKIQLAFKMKYEMVWFPMGHNALYPPSHSPLIKIATGQRMQPSFLLRIRTAFGPRQIIFS